MMTGLYMAQAWKHGALNAGLLKYTPWTLALRSDPLMLQAREYLVEHDALPSGRGVLLRREEHKVAVYIVGRLRRRGTSCQLSWWQWLASHVHSTISCDHAR